MAVLASGRGSNFQALVDAVAAGRLAVRLVGVFCDRAGAPVLGRAAAASVPAHLVDASAAASRAQAQRELFDALAAAAPDLVVCAGYMRLIDDALLQPWIGRMLNIHPSLLPAYPGLRTHARALADGARVHGASVHFVTPELDAGPVLAQARVPVHAGDDVGTLAARVLAAEHPLLVAAVELFASARVGWKDGRPLLDGAPLRRPLQLTDACLADVPSETLP